MKKIIPRLRELLDGTGSSDSPPWTEDVYDRDSGLMLVEGMEEAVRNNENLEFC